jgi:hypothetical protein
MQIRKAASLTICIAHARLIGNVVHVPLTRIVALLYCPEGLQVAYNEEVAGFPEL